MLVEDCPVEGRVKSFGAAWSIAMMAQEQTTCGHDRSVTVPKDERVG